MSFLHRFGTVLHGHGSSPRGDVEREIDAELRSHVALRAEYYEQSGMDPGRAGQLALDDFGDFERIASACRTIRAGALRETLTVGLRIGALVSCVTLGLTAVLLLADTTLLRPSPEVADDGLFTVKTHFRFDGADSPGRVSIADFRSWRDAEALDGAALFRIDSLPASRGHEATTVRVASVSAGFFELFGVEPDLGRVFLDSEVEPQTAAVAVVSREFWLDRLGQGWSTAEQTLVVNGREHDVVGILGPEATRRLGYDVAVPLVAGPNDSWRDYRVYDAMVRLSPEVDLAGAQAALTAISDSLASAYPRFNRYFSAVIGPVGRSDAGSIRFAWFLTLALCVALFPIARWPTVRGGRGLAEAVELAAAGGGHRTVGHSLRWWLVPSIVAAVLGAAVAYRSLESLIAVLLPNAVQLYPLRLDPQVLIGLVPLVIAFAALAVRERRSGGSPAGPEPESRREWTACRRLALTAATTAGVLAVSVAVGAITHAWSVAHTDVGYDPSATAVARITLPEGRYPRAADKRAFVRDVLARVDAERRVALVGIAEAVPPEGNHRRRWIARGSDPPDEAGQNPKSADLIRVDAGFMDIVRFRLVEGRAMGPQASDREVVINQAMAREFWPSESAVGRSIQIGVNSRWYEIVGVVEDVSFRGLSERPWETVFVSFDEMPVGEFSIVARGRGSDPPVEALAAAIRAVDPAVSGDRIEAAAALIGSSRRGPIVFAGFTTLVALALLVVSSGGYGTMRTHGSHRPGAWPVLCHAAMGVAVGAVILRPLSGWFRTGPGPLDSIALLDGWVAGGGVLLAVALGIVMQRTAEAHRRDSQPPPTGLGTLGRL